MDEPGLARIEEFFRRRGRKMTDANRSQAMAPAGAEALTNEVGTAPGLAAVLGEARVFVMPGVPSEMKWMFHHVIAPRLPAGSGAILHHTVHAEGGRGWLPPQEGGHG